MQDPLRVHTLLRCTIKCPMLLFILRQIALKPPSLHLHALHMWYFPRTEDICQTTLHWEENHYIHIILFWGTHILFSLTVPLYYLTVNVHRKCQHSTTESILEVIHAKYPYFKISSSPCFSVLNGCWVRRKKIKLKEVFCIMKSNFGFREIWEQYIQKKVLRQIRESLLSPADCLSL